MFVGVCRLTLHLQANNSLKGKRKVLRSVVDRCRSKFNASVAEVADNDVLKRAVIGISVIGNNGGHVDSMLSKIESFVESMYLAPILSSEREIIPMGDQIGGFENSVSGNHAGFDSPDSLDSEREWEDDLDWDENL